MNWTKEQVDAHNRRMKTAKQHNAESGVGHYEFSGNSAPASMASPAALGSVGVVTTANFVVRPSNDESKLNKTERAYLAELRRLNYPHIGIQSITLKLGDDCRFTPDFNYLNASGEMVMVDVKGFQRDDALVKIKTAARQFPMFRFVIVKRVNGLWEETVIKP